MFRPLVSNDSAKALGPVSATETDLNCAVLIDQGTLILVGRARTAVPSAGTITFTTGDTANSDWAAMSWPPAAPSADTLGAVAWFLAVLRFDNIARVKSLRANVQAQDGSCSLSLPEIDKIELEALPLLEQMREAVAPMGAVFDFLRRALLAAPDLGSQRVRRFLAGLLRTCSRQDGFVEILGRPECGGLVLQGWSLHLAPGAQEVFVETASVEDQAAMVAVFERSDLIASARGILAYLRDLKSTAPDEVRRVYFRTGDDYHHLDIVENRIVHGEHESALHVKSMLDRLEADISVMRALKRVCRPRFEGKETVSTLPKPVRAAQDIALAAKNGGVFVSGWLLDPSRLVQLVLLKSTANFYARIDEIWHRMPRPDVNQGFAQDELFRDCLRDSDDHHGFMVFVAREEPARSDERYYLEFVLEDGSCGFLPLGIVERGENAVIRQLLNGVSVDDPGIADVIGRHIGPIAVAAAARRPAPQAVSASTAFGPSVARPTLSVIVPTDRDRADFDVNLARLADDPDFDGAEFIVVAPRTGCAQLLNILRKHAEFYGIGGRVVFSAERLDVLDAMEVGARAATSEAVLFLSPNVLPKEKGWLSRLGTVFTATSKAGSISPTLLYEDYSIRFAGSPVQTPIDFASDTPNPHAGYPAHWLDSREVVVVRSGTAECCLMPRGTFLEIGGFGRELLAPDLKFFDFALRLDRAGLRSLWCPSVALYAHDEFATSADSEYWLKPALMVDRWSLARKWADSTAKIGSFQ